VNSSRSGLWSLLSQRSTRRTGWEDCQTSCKPCLWNKGCAQGLQKCTEDAHSQDSDYCLSTASKRVRPKTNSSHFHQGRDSLRLVNLKNQKTSIVLNLSTKSQTPFLTTLTNPWTANRPNLKSERTRWRANLILPSLGRCIRCQKRLLRLILDSLQSLKLVLASQGKTIITQPETCTSKEMKKLTSPVET